MANTPTLMQSEEERAPWNESPEIRETIPVIVSITLSKRMYIDATPDAAGNFNNLEEEAENQHWLPKEILETVAHRNDFSASLKKDCKDWFVDELVVMQD